MELYLDSANLKEIEEGFKLGFLNGLTTTPTFMQREGITDIDSMIVKLSKIVPVLQIEALGNTAEEVVKEAHRQLKLGLNPKKTVFKIPASLEAMRACYLLRKDGLLVNIHLVYTLQQAYMAMHAGATYVCPLVGRLQDQGHDALALVEQCVNAVNHYGYNTKIMFSSVRHCEHVRNAINLGVHTITVPLKVMKALTDNNLTAMGTDQFLQDTRLMTTTVGDAMRKENPTVDANTTIKAALVPMTNCGFGAITVLNEDKSIRGVFTDGDLRRLLKKDGNIVDTKLKEVLPERQQKFISIATSALLNDAKIIFNKEQVDTIVITDKKGHAVGMLDIQDVSSKM